MKIAIITSPFGNLPPSGFGAVEKLWYNLGVKMAEMGSEVAFYCRRPESSQEELYSRVKVFHLKGFRRTGSGVADLLLDFDFSLRAVLALARCDILILNTFWSPFLCQLVKFKFSKSVYNVQRFPKGQFKLFRHIDRLACVSQAVAKALVAQTPARAKQIRVIGNPVDVSAFTTKLAEHSSDAIKLCFTGRVHPEKGIDILIKAYVMLRQKYPKLSLSIVGARKTSEGGGGDFYVTHLKQILGDAPIRWVDPISDARKLAEEIAECDIYCYPSVAEKGETFGVSPLEAMAVGRAIVVSDLDCFKDFVDEGVTGLIFDHRAASPENALANKIEYLICHPEDRLKMAAAGARVAHDNFHTQKIAQEYLNDFAELLCDKDRKASPYRGMP